MLTRLPHHLHHLFDLFVQLQPSFGRSLMNIKDLVKQTSCSHQEDPQEVRLEQNAVAIIPSMSPFSPHEGGASSFTTAPLSEEIRVACDTPAQVRGSQSRNGVFSIETLTSVIKDPILLIPWSRRLPKPAEVGIWRYHLRAACQRCVS